MVEEVRREILDRVRSETEEYYGGEDTVKREINSLRRFKRKAGCGS